MFTMKTLGKAALASGLRPMKNEDGSVIVIALILLALATVMGISGTTTTSVELQIAGNDRIQKQNFFLADAGLMENAQLVQNNGALMANPATAGFNWFHNLSDLPDQNDVTNDSNWTNQFSQVFMVTNANSGTPNPGITNSTRFLTVYQGVSGGTSLDISKARVYQYRLDSRTIRYNGRIYLEAGFRTAF